MIQARVTENYGRLKGIVSTRRTIKGVVNIRHPKLKGRIQLFQSLLVSDTLDEHGGIIRTITGKVVKLQPKRIKPELTEQTVFPDIGYDGFSEVIVEAGGEIIDDYEGGAYDVTPLPFESQTFETKGKRMTDDVTVRAIPYYETSNVSGITIYIGGE